MGGSEGVETQDHTLVLLGERLASKTGVKRVRILPSVLDNALRCVTITTQWAASRTGIRYACTVKDRVRLPSGPSAGSLS